MSAAAPEPTNWADPDPSGVRRLDPKDDAGIMRWLERIESQLDALKRDAYEQQLANEVLTSQNRLLHETHETDRKTIVRLLREIEALKTEQPDDEL